MGIINPRPAMRAREERNIREAIKWQTEWTLNLMWAGIPKDEASTIAFNILTSRVARKKIWRTK